MVLTPEKSNIRAFAALCLNQPLLDCIGEEQRRLQTLISSNQIRWVRKEQIHLTLHFYGNVPCSEIEELNQRLSLAARHTKSFELTVGGIGFFPSLHRPRIIWFGLQGSLDELKTLQNDIETDTRQFGSQFEDRSFKPHLTVARVKCGGPETRRIASQARDVSVAILGKWRVEELVLMRSELSIQGSTYSALSKIRFE